MKILECSSKGDKRFSALYARVNVYGIEDSIEYHYQSCKRDDKGNVAGKGKKVSHIKIPCGLRKWCIFTPDFLTAYYKLLWCCYLDDNKDLVEYAATFDDYNDMFRGKAINCQADVIRQYVKQGRQSILQEPKVIQLRNTLGI